MYFIHNNFQLHLLSFSASLTLLQIFRQSWLLKSWFLLQGLCTYCLLLLKSSFPRSLLDWLFFSCGVWDLVPWPGVTWTWAPCIGSAEFSLLYHQGSLFFLDNEAFLSSCPTHFIQKFMGPQLYAKKIFKECKGQSWHSLAFEGFPLSLG